MLGSKKNNLRPKKISKLIIKSKISFTKVVHYDMLFENVQLKVTINLSFVKKAVITSQAYQKLISGISHINLRHISRIYQPFCSLSSVIYQKYLKHLSDISQIFIRHIQGIFLASFRPITGIAQRFKCLLTNDKILVNSISFNPFMNGGGGFSVPP